jgi:hypothetical protein
MNRTPNLNERLFFRIRGWEYYLTSLMLFIGFVMLLIYSHNINNDLLIIPSVIMAYLGIRMFVFHLKDDSSIIAITVSYRKHNPENNKHNRDTSEFPIPITTKVGSFNSQSNKSRNTHPND